MLIRAKSKSLKDLIDQLDWATIEVARAANRLPPNQVMVTFRAAHKKNPDLINEVVIRIGREVLERLEWDAGDKILPCYNPDDQMLFLMVKTDSGVGYRLQRETNATSCRVAFRWNRDIPLHQMPPRKVEFDVHTKKLIFRVGETDYIEA